MLLRVSPFFTLWYLREVVAVVVLEPAVVAGLWFVFLAAGLLWLVEATSELPEAVGL